jgi:hypothetical protein
MVAMDGFYHLLNWKLKQGSHAFPGPDGGTCINEAALVVAGFEYRPIYAAEHMPECFSRPICRLAMRLNDRAKNEERQRLLPYVARLACADTPEIERKRKAYIRRHGCSWLFGPNFERGLQVLEGALAIGRQADLLGLDEVQTRMDAARAGSPLASEKPFFSKVKSWLTQKKIKPAAELA